MVKERKADILQEISLEVEEDYPSSSQESH